MMFGSVWFRYDAEIVGLRNSWLTSTAIIIYVHTYYTLLRQYSSKSLLLLYFAEFVVEFIAEKKKSKYSSGSVKIMERGEVGEGIKEKTPARKI